MMGYLKNPGGWGRSVSRCPTVLIWISRCSWQALARMKTKAKIKDSWRWSSTGPSWWPTLTPFGISSSTLELWNTLKWRLLQNIDVNIDIYRLKALESSSLKAALKSDLWLLILEQSSKRAFYFIEIPVGTCQTAKVIVISWQHITTLLTSDCAKNPRKN